MIGANVSTYRDPGTVASLTGSPPVPRTIELAPRTNEKSDSKPLSTASEKSETNVDLDALGKAVEQLQAAAQLVDDSLQFKVDNESKTVQVIVMNKDTEEVIREIPPSEILKAAARLKEVIGLLIDTTA